MRKRIMLALASIAMLFGVGIATTGTAHASVWDGQWCSTGLSGCINAWGGGPFVKQYNGVNVKNNNFSLFQQSPTVYYSLKFFGGGTYNGKCIGDANNDQNDARAYLDSCGTGGTGEGWGVNFTTGQSGCPTGYSWFHNVHWGGYLGPAGTGNGSQYYLNKPGKVCFAALGPA